VVLVLGEPSTTVRIDIDQSSLRYSTRCPTECRLSRSNEPWKCVIKLRRTLSKGQLRSETFGDTIYEDAKSEVEDRRVRRAQLAILNPSKNAKHYLTVQDAWERDPLESSFSKDCVMLEISGPDVADLSFCDLPGAVLHPTGSCP
jgi:hypothetical protein